MSFVDKIKKYFDAGFPLLYIESFEEGKIIESIKEAADRRNILIWGNSCGYGEYSTGVREWLVPMNKDDYGMNLDSILESKISISDELDRTVFIIKDAHIALTNKNTITALKEISYKIQNGLDCCVILISPILEIPVEIEKYITILHNDVLDFEGIKAIVEEFCEVNEIEDLSPSLTEELAITLKGLTEYEIENLLSLAAAEDGKLNRKDLDLIFKQKKQMILKSGILEMISVKESVNDIGGLDTLKEWLTKKAKVMKNIRKAQQFGVDIPKGVLIAGVPGCGKSLCAKAASSLFEVPLLRLDIGKLMGKYLGESEANLRKAIELAETISPCILWVDELEKAFAGIGNNGGHEVTTRLFGTFLTWMQEKTSSTFVVATANNIMNLPPELLRRGRFDEIFFVGLPNDDERKKIFEIHINKRRPNDIAKISVDNLVKATKGFCGADIEGLVKDAVEEAYTTDKDHISNEIFNDIIKDSHPLSEIMKDQLDKMIELYKKNKFKNASK